MTLFLSIAGAVLPSILLLRYFYKKDLYPEPGSVIALTFFLGILTVIPVLIVALPMVYINPFKGMVFRSAVYTAFFTAAIPEEFFKFRVLMRYSVKHKSFNEPMDGIVYGVTASLGFATLENIMYVVQGNWTVAVLRALTSVPGHASWGAIMGFFIGQAAFDKKHRKSMYLGLFTAILLHGLYDLPLMYLANNEAATGPHDITILETWAILFFLFIHIFSIIWALSLVKRLRKRQEQHRSQIL